MRTYKKPVMRLEHFTAKNAVATGCYEERKEEVNEQTINCVIEGYEEVFLTEGGCRTDASQAGTIGDYNGSTYFLWYTGTSSVQPTDKQTALLSAIEEALGRSDAIGQHGWHAGLVTSTIWNEWNATS